MTQHGKEQGAETQRLGWYMEDSNDGDMFRSNLGYMDWALAVDCCVRRRDENDDSPEGSGEG